MSKASKLRFESPKPPFHVILVEPEIPPNTGSIARTCAATGTALHLVEPLGFRVDEHAVRRAGLDYWHLVDLHIHPNFIHAKDAIAQCTTPGIDNSPERKRRFHLFSANASRSYVNADFQPGDILVFGRESVGLPEDLLSLFPETTWAIPTISSPAVGGVRSLNLSNAVSIVLYEALRNSGALDRTFLETTVQELGLETGD